MKMTHPLTSLLLITKLCAINHETPYTHHPQLIQRNIFDLQEMQLAIKEHKQTTLKKTAHDYAYGLLMVMRMQLLWENTLQIDKNMIVKKRTHARIN